MTKTKNDNIAINPEGILTNNQVNCDSSDKAEIDKLMLEYKILQTKIDSYGSYSYKIKSIFLPSSAAAIYYIFVHKDILMACLAFVGIIIFFYYEIINNIYKSAIMNRVIVVERLLNYSSQRRKRMLSPRVAQVLISKHLITHTSFFKAIISNWKSDIMYHILILVFLTSILYLLKNVLLYLIFIILLSQVLIVIWAIYYSNKLNEGQ